MGKKVVISIIVVILLIFSGAIFTYEVVINKEDLISKTYDIDEFSSINIDIKTADLEFKVSTDGAKKVVCEERKKVYHEVKVENDTLYIKSIDTRPWYEKFDFIFNKMKVTVYIPSGLYNNLNIESSTGDIYIPQEYSFNEINVKLSTGQINIKANSINKANIESTTGDISLEMNAKSLNIKASTGIIKLNKVAVEEKIDIKTSTGNIVLNEVTAKNIDVNSSTGVVQLVSSIIEVHIEIETSTGDVKLEKSDSNTLHIKTATGNVKGTLLTNKIFIAKTDTGKVNVPVSTTGGLCQIETDTGNINIVITN